MYSIKKFFKKRRLLKKYRLTDQKMIDQIYLTRLMSDDPEFLAYFRHNNFCEIRCYNRLVNGHMISKKLN